jgi:hypothetical protein
MQLSHALFEQITSTLHREGAAAAALATPPDPRRREPRVDVRLNVTVIPIGDRLQVAPFDVPLRDLSSGGIGFVHTSKLSLDDQFVVLFPVSDESVAVLCQVAHYQPLAERQFAVGARFVRVLRHPAGCPTDGTTIGLPVHPQVARRAAS